MLAFSIDYYGIFFGATQSVELFCTYDKITELYLQQQKFHERVFKTIGGVVTLALGVTVTMLGLKAIGSDEDLPQLDDENQNVA